jgi:hypothetical protein
MRVPYKRTICVFLHRTPLWLVQYSVFVLLFCMQIVFLHGTPLWLVQYSVFVLEYCTSQRGVPCKKTICIQNNKTNTEYCTSLSARWAKKIKYKIIERQYKLSQSTPCNITSCCFVCISSFYTERPSDLYSTLCSSCCFVYISSFYTERPSDLYSTRRQSGYNTSRRTQSIVPNRGEFRVKRQSGGRVLCKRTIWVQHNKTNTEYCTSQRGVLCKKTICIQNDKTNTEYCTSQRGVPCQIVLIHGTLLWLAQ